MKSALGGARGPKAYEAVKKSSSAASFKYDLISKWSIMVTGRFGPGSVRGERSGDRLGHPDAGRGLQLRPLPQLRRWLPYKILIGWCKQTVGRFKTLFILWKIRIKFHYNNFHFWCACMLGLWQRRCQHLMGDITNYIGSVVVDYVLHWASDTSW